MVLWKKNNFVESSLMSALSFLKEATLYEEYALRKGFLQSLDPRIKAVAILLFIITAVSLKKASLICFLYFLCVILAVFSKIPIGFFLMRTWIFIPLFSIFIVIPSVFNFITPGESVGSLSLLGMKFIITRQGIDSAVVFIARIATSVSMAVLLSLTTRHAELLKVLRIFRIPQIFILTLSMCYRYLYIFAVMVENIFTAIKSRVGVVAHCRKGQHIVAWNISNMWARANQMNEDVYHAMLSRGYTGEPRLLKGFGLGVKDGLWFLCAVAFFIVLFFMEKII